MLKRINSMQVFRNFFIFFSVFISGAAILIVEILGTRILAPLYGTTIYVWSALLTVTLFSLAFGYFIGGRIADKKNSPLWFFSIFILAGLSLLVMMSFKGAALLYSDNFNYTYAPLIASALLFTIPLGILGMVDPFAIKLETGEITVVGTKSGTIFGISTVGGLTGALSTAYILLPSYPISQIINYGGILLIIIGVLGIMLLQGLDNELKNKKNLVLKSIILISIFVVLYILASYGKDLTHKAIADSKKFQQAVILYQNQNIYSMNRIIVIPNVDGQYCFSADSGLQSCIDPRNKDYVDYVGKMGVFMNSLDKNSKMLLMGMGVGKAIKEWGREDIDTDIVDINPATFYADQKYVGVKFNPREKIHVEDGRKFLRKSETKYDLILVDVSTTLTPPTHFYTKEFFALLKNHLKDNGFVVFQTTEPDYRTDLAFQALLTTARSQFSYTYADRDGISVLLVMSKTKNSENLAKVNKGIENIQIKFNAAHDVHTFSKIEPELNIPIVTDDFNLSEIYWRDKIPFIQRFNYLLKDDFI